MRLDLLRASATVTLRCIGASALLLACHASRPSTAPEPQARALHDSWSRVPALPPNQDMTVNVAREVYSPSNISEGDSVITGPFPRDVLWVWFQDGAGQPERQAAIDLIHGTVVGGAPIRPGGIYHVRIHANGTTGPLQRAIAALKTLPQIRLATVDLSILMSGPQVH
jgi:hypothetical protein